MTADPYEITGNNAEPPEGWAEAAVADLTLDVQSGFASGRKDVKGGLPHLRMNNIGEEGHLVLDLIRTVPSDLARPQHELERGDVLVCTTNSGKLVGKCALFDLAGEFAFSNHLTRLRPNPTSINPSLLRWELWLTWRSGIYEEACRNWVNQSTLPKEALLASRLPLPPLAEQTRIVAKVEALLARVDAARERLAKVPTLLKRFRQSVLAAACAGQLTADWRDTHPGIESGADLLARIKEARFATAKSTKEKNQVLQAFDDRQAVSADDEPGVEDIPDTWLACRVGALGTVCNGSTPSRKRMEFWGGNIPWVSSGEVRNNIIAATRERIAKAGYESCSVHLLPRGTVLLAMIGEGKTRGQSSVLQIEATINQNIAAVLIPHGLVNSTFLWRWFQFRYEATREQGGGSGPQALNCQRVRELPFIMPPLDEQHEIVRRVEALFALADKIEARVQAATARVGKITQAILAKAFRGELVPTEAQLARQEGRAYEPASVLLERIRTTHAAEASNTRQPTRRGRRKPNR